MHKIIGVLACSVAFLGLAACSDDANSASSVSPEGTRQIISDGDLVYAVPMGGDVVYTIQGEDNVTIGWFGTFDFEKNSFSLATNDTLTAIAAYDGGVVAFIVGDKLMVANLWNKDSEENPLIKVDTLVQWISSLGGRSAVAVNADGVYYKDGSSIKVFPLEKGYVDMSAAPIELVDRVYNQDNAYSAFSDLIVSDNVLYASVAWDSPNGTVVSVDLNGIDWKHGERPELRTFADGLGSPTDLQATDDYVCINGTSISCVSKRTGEKKVIQSSSLFALNNYRLASYGNQLFFQSPDGYFYRYSLDDGRQTQLTKYSGTAMASLLSQSGSLVAMEGHFFWLEKSNAIFYLNLQEFESVSKEKEQESSVSPPKVSNSCMTETGSYKTTPYAGSYMGRFEYRTKPEDSENWTANSFTVNIAMECVADMLGMTTLKIVWAQSNDPFFGCTMGCTPQEASAAILPSGEANPSSPSLGGAGFTISFPNGALLTTSNAEGEMNVSTDGRTIASDFDAGYGVTGDKQMTWIATKDGETFPSEFKGTVEMTSWIFNWSAL
jgi:hypothetical protein